MKKLNIVQNWGRWCECHNGALPPFDLNGYQCQKCKQIVCVNCIYKTEKGYICADCIPKLKPKTIFPITPEYKKNTKNYILLVTLGVIFSLAIFLVIIFLKIENYLVLLGFLPIIIAVIIGIKPILFEKKKNEAKISEKELKNLDEKMKKQKKIQKK